MQRIGPTRLRILDLILSSPRRLTVREIAGRIGNSINAVNGHLDALRRDGLVMWEPHQCHTLRATCRFVPAESLEKAGES